MNIATVSDTYTPKMDMNTNQYLDHNIINFKDGIICPCTNSLKIFYKKEQFNSHKKTKKHQSWLNYLNENASNYYKETIEQQKTIKTQQLLLTDMENKLKQKDTILLYLEGRIKTLEQKINGNNENPISNINLLDFD